MTVAGNAARLRFLLDVNHDKKIDLKTESSWEADGQFRSVVDMSAMLKQLDSNKDGVVRPREIQRWVRTFDKDRNRVLSDAESGVLTQRFYGSIAERPLTHQEATDGPTIAGKVHGHFIGLDANLDDRLDVQAELHLDPKSARARELDTNGNGFVTGRELTAWYSTHDRDGDGRIRYNEIPSRPSGG
jgi:hypothetical protein